MAGQHSETQEASEELLSPRRAPLLLERLTSKDESTVEDELSEDLGYPTLGGTQHRNFMQKATDRGSSFLSWFRKMTRGRYEDWLFLVILGSLMGLYSFGIDVAVMKANQYRLAAFMTTTSLASRVVVWFILTALVSVSAALFLAWFIPSATGSGFPEIKAYLQGVKMENTFSPITCIGKLVFLPIMLCTALPLGKEGPVTHVAAVFALFITKVFKDISVEELERHTGNELVAAACTMGAAVCYGAPVGGVLFSIESTRTYFAVRNYWRGFFAAVCGTIFYKGLSQIYHGIDILPMYQEVYIDPLPFNFEFLFISIGIGLLCGLLGPAFVWLHRQLLKLIQRTNALSPECRCCSAPGGTDAKQSRTCHAGMLTKHKVSVFRFLYTIAICVLMAAATLPWRDGYSAVMSHISTREQVTDLMANVSWGSPPGGASAANVSSLGVPSSMNTAPVNITLSTDQAVFSDDRGSENPAEHRTRSQQILARWTDGFHLDYRTVLVIYMLFYFFGTMISTTLTLPSGTFIPVFKVGIAMGRLLGEVYCGYRLPICMANSAVASGFACMTGAALIGSVTHAISVSVIVFELTGQITYVLPVLTSVLVSNALSRHIQPSMVDSLTMAKGITVLPKITTSKIAGGYANVHAKDLMLTEFRVVTQRATLNSLRKLVRQVQNPAKVLPLVDDEENMEPVGLVHVRRVRRLLREELGNIAWQRDKPKFYLTLNAFKSLDWDSVRDDSAVGRLGLEVDSSVRTPTSSPKSARKLAGVDEDLGSHPSVYCTVTKANEAKIPSLRHKLLVPKIVVDLASKPRRSALKSGSTSPGPLKAVRENSAEDEKVIKLARFSVKKISEEEGSVDSVAMTPLKSNASMSGDQSVGDSGVVEAPHLEVDSGSSSDGSTKESAGVSLLGGRRGRHRSPSAPPARDSESREVYDSLVSNSSRAAKMRDGLTKLISKRSGNLDLESRQQNASERLRRQFSISDLNEGENDGLANMGQLIQKTLDRTTTMFSGITSPKERSDTEVRLRRAWRRRQLNREVLLREVIEVDPFPLTVNVDTPLVQVHRMFAMLCANKMYVTDRRRLVGCLPLQRLSEFITRGHVGDPGSADSGQRTVTSDAEVATQLRGRRDSQDTLDGIDDSVYDTVTEPPFTSCTATQRQQPPEASGV